MARRIRAHTDTSDEVDGAEPPVFIVGAPRSGTTLLYKVLCMHPEAAWISNWVRRSPWATALAELNRIPALLPSLQARVWFGVDSNAYVYGTRRPSWKRAFPMPVEGEPVFELVGTTDTPARDLQAPEAMDDRMRLFRSRLGSIRRLSGGSVFINKRIANNRRIARLRQAFPSARFVDVIRDGRAVAYSLSSVDWWPTSQPWWLDRTPEQWAAEGGDPWELCGRSWVEEIGAIEEGLRGVPPDEVFHVRYEELIARPLASARSVAAFAGLSDNEAWLGRVHRLRFPDRNERWRHLEPEEVAAIERIQTETLRRYGYA